MKMTSLKTISAALFALTLAALGFSAEPPANVQKDRETNAVVGNLVGKTIPTVAALKAISVSGLSTGYLVNLQNNATANDGGGGPFYYSSVSAVADNGGTVIAPTVGTGRWLRIYSPAVINSSWFGGDLSACYTALPSAGGVIQLGDNVAITTATTISVAAGKAVTLDLNNYTITFTHTSGSGLKFTSIFGDRTSPVVIKNGTLKYAGASTGVTGLEMLFSLYAELSNLRVLNFSTTGSVGVHWDWVEDSSANSVEFNNNATGLELYRNTNQNAFSSVWFQSNVMALRIYSTSDVNTFTSCIFQQNTGIHTVSLEALAGEYQTLNNFTNCWFEANGDGSINARDVYISAAATGSNVSNIFQSNFFNYAIDDGAENIGWSGAGTLGRNTVISNEWSIRGIPPSLPADTLAINLDGTITGVSLAVTGAISGATLAAQSTTLTSSAEARVNVVKSGASANTSYFYNNGVTAGLFDSTNSRSVLTYTQAANTVKIGSLTTNGIATVSGGDGTMGSSTAGANVLTALGVAVGTDGAFVVKGGALGTPSSGTLTNATGLPIAGIASLGTGVGAALAATTNTGSGLVTFNTLGTGAFQPQTVLTGTANQIAVSNSGVGATTISIPTNPTLPGNVTLTGTNTLKFGATAAATINVSADTTAGILTFTAPSTGSFKFTGAAGSTLSLLRPSTSFDSALFFQTGASSDFLLRTTAGASNLELFSYGPNANVLTIAKATGVIAALGTVSASSSTTGTVVIGNGTAATNVGIGGGNVYAGGNIFSIANSADAFHARFYSGAASGGSASDGDMFLQYGKAFNVNVGDGTAVSNLIMNKGTIRLKTYTVATLPAGTQGDTAVVTDATAPTYLGVLVGSGAIVTPVFYNGSAWVSY